MLQKLYDVDATSYGKIDDMADNKNKVLSGCQLPIKGKVLTLYSRRDLKWC